MRDFLSRPVTNASLLGYFIGFVIARALIVLVTS
jgi:hypothetical protein